MRGLAAIVGRIGEGAEDPTRSDWERFGASVGSRCTLEAALLLNLENARRVPAIRTAAGIVKTHLRGAKGARGIEGLPDLAEIMAAGGVADPILTGRQDLAYTFKVPYELAAVGKDSTDVGNAGIAILIQLDSLVADIMRAGLRLGRGGPRQPAQTDRNQQPLEAGQPTRSFGSRAL